MIRDKRVGWLAELQVGDKVWASPTHRGASWRHVVVEKISPTGILTTNHEQLSTTRSRRSFDPDGLERVDVGLPSQLP